MGEATRAESVGPAPVPGPAVRVRDEAIEALTEQIHESVEILRALRPKRTA